MQPPMRVASNDFIDPQSQGNQICQWIAHCCGTPLSRKHCATPLCSAREAIFPAPRDATSLLDVLGGVRDGAVGGEK